MGVLLQGFFKSQQNRSVPSPADGDRTIPWWWDHLAAQAKDLRLAGFTAVWLPPVLKTPNGSRPDADGYGPFDDYDIGSKNQHGSVETRFGSREQLQRCVAAFRACGVDVYLDMVEHHRSGDTKPFVFRYPGADGKPDVGRFPKDPFHFIPQVPHDPNLGGPVADDMPFGRELAPINGRPPKHYVMDNLIAAADWLTRSLDVQGYRLDDVKGLSSDFLVALLDSKSMAGKFAVGEFFDGNRVVVEGWVANPGAMRGPASAFDFPLKFVLNAMCNAPGQFDMRALDHVGLAGIDPLRAVTFVENHDTDLQAANKIVTNKTLGYAYILTSEGYPCVYYRDYSTDVGCYGLKPQIDNLIWVHEKLAAGPTQQRFLDPRLFVYERLGGPHLLVGLNSDGGAHTVNVQTGFGPNVHLHDYAGHAGDVFTDGVGGSDDHCAVEQRRRGVRLLQPRRFRRRRIRHRDAPGHAGLRRGGGPGHLTGSEREAGRRGPHLERREHADRGEHEARYHRLGRGHGRGRGDPRAGRRRPRHRHVHPGLAAQLHGSYDGPRRGLLHASTHGPQHARRQRQPEIHALSNLHRRRRLHADPR